MGTVLNWMKQFLILYLILTILTQLAAAEAYKKYLRFLSGIPFILNPHSRASAARSP